MCTKIGNKDYIQVVPPDIVNALGWFQAQVERWLTRQLQRRTTDKKWRYTSAATAREGLGLLTIEENFRRRQNTVTQYISTQSLLYLCEGSERAPGALGVMWYWEQEGIDLTGAMEAAAAVVGEDRV